MSILHGAIEKHAGGETLKAIIDLDREVKRLRGIVNNISQQRLATQTNVYPGSGGSSAVGTISFGEGFALPSPAPQYASIFLLKLGDSAESRLCYTAPGSDNVWRWYEIVATG